MQKVKDVIIRSTWTFVQVLVPLLTVEAFNLPAQWILLGAVVLAAIKTTISQVAGASTRGAEDQMASENRTVQAPR